jgi:prevent-host-death family protein
MTVVGAYEAKTHLPQLIEKVLQGETIQITRHGTPVANLCPVGEKKNPADVVDELRRFRKGKRLDGISIKDLISEGQK